MPTTKKFQHASVPLSTVNTTAQADAVRKESAGTHEDPGCLAIISQGCSAMKEMPKPHEKTLRLLNDYQKASPALRESLSEGGFIAANGELDEPYARENWQMLWEIFPGEKFKDIPEGAGVTKAAEGLLHATESLLQDVVASAAESAAGTDELTGMQPAIAKAEEEVVDAQTLRLLLDEEIRESVVATANEFIMEGGINREYLDDSGPELKAAVESLENTLGKLDGLDETQEKRLTALENKAGGLTSEEQKELSSLQKLKKKLACSEERSVLAAAVKVVKDSMEVIQVSPETVKGLSAGEKQIRLDACEALKDLSAALEDSVNILKSVKAAAKGSDVLGLPEKLSNARHKIKNALEVVKARRNASIESTYPDKSGRVKAALVKVSEPGSKKDPVTDVLDNLKAHEQNLEKGVYRELIYIREATQTLSRAVDTLPKGKVRDAVSQLQRFCEFLTPDLKMLVSGKPPAIASTKELKAAATAAVAMYRTLIGADMTADEPKTRRDVFNEAVEKLTLAHKSISSKELKPPLRETGLAFSLVREDTRNLQSVGSGADTVTQLKEMAVVLRGAYAKIAHVVSGVTEKMGSPGPERKKLTDLLEVKSEPLLTSLHWFELKGKALAGSAKAANKVADMLVHKKGTDSLSNVSDMRAKSAKAVSLARTELKEAFSFVEHRWQETQKTLHALQTTSQNEFTLAKAQLTAMEKDDPRKFPAQPEDISQQRKKVDTLRRFLTDIQKCQGGFKEAVNQARKAEGSAEALTFSQDRLTKTEVGLPASEVLLQAEGAMRTAAAALQVVTHREPEVYGPQQKVAMYLALVLAERMNEKEELSPAEKQAQVAVLAEKLAGDIDSPGFDRKAFAVLIKENYRQKCDGTLKLPREYRAVLAEPGLKWANLMTDKGAARLGSSLVSMTLRKLISQSVNILMPGGIVGSAWGRIRGAVSAGLIYQAGKERVNFLKQSVMPGHALPSGTLSGARNDTWKFVAASTADAALPQVLRAAKNGLAMLNDIKKNGFAHTMEQAGNHFVANNLITSGTTLAAAGGREGAEAAAEFITDAMESAAERNQVFPYQGKGDRVEQAVGKMADIVRRGRAGPESMGKDEVATIDRALDNALKDLAQEKARLNGILTKTERDFIKERGLTPAALVVACDAQSEKLRSYQKEGKNANQLVVLGKVKPGQRDFDACVRDGDSRIFIREGAAGKDLLRHEVTHLWGKGEKETRNIMATLMGLRTGDHSIAWKVNINLNANDEKNTNGLHFGFGGGGLLNYRKPENKPSPPITSNVNQSTPLVEGITETQKEENIRGAWDEDYVTTKVIVPYMQSVINGAETTITKLHAPSYIWNYVQKAIDENGLSPLTPDSRIKTTQIITEGRGQSSVTVAKKTTHFTLTDLVCGKLHGINLKVEWDNHIPPAFRDKILPGSSSGLFTTGDTDSAITAAFKGEMANLEKDDGTTNNLSAFYEFSFHSTARELSTSEDIDDRFKNQLKRYINKEETPKLMSLNGEKLKEVVALAQGNKVSAWDALGDYIEFDNDKNLSQKEQNWILKHLSIKTQDECKNSRKKFDTFTKTWITGNKIPIEHKETRLALSKTNNIGADTVKTIISRMKQDMDTMVKTPNELLRDQLVNIAFDLVNGASSFIPGKGIITFMAKIALSSSISVAKDLTLATLADSNEEKQAILSNVLQNILAGLLFDGIAIGSNYAGKCMKNKSFKSIENMFESRVKGTLPTLDDSLKVTGIDLSGVKIERTGVFHGTYKKGEQYYIQQDGSAFEVFRDRSSNTWRLKNPDQSSTYHMPVSYHADTNSWGPNSSVGLQGGARTWGNSRLPQGTYSKMNPDYSTIGQPAINMGPAIQRPELKNNQWVNSKGTLPTLDDSLKVTGIDLSGVKIERTGIFHGTYKKGEQYYIQQDGSAFEVFRDRSSNTWRLNNPAGDSMPVSYNAETGSWEI